MRVLVYADKAKRTDLLCTVATEAGFACVAYPSAAALCAGFDESAGACVIAEEVLDDQESYALIRAALASQPSWSDLPVLIVAKAGASLRSSATEQLSLGSALIIQRPVRVATLGNALQFAFRSRIRQLDSCRTQDRKPSEQALSDSEERLRRAQRLESVGLLVGGVAHDFNNLFTVIIASAGAALDQCPTCENYRAILSAGERAAELTRQLVAYAGKAQDSKSLVNLNDLVSRSKALLAASVPKRVRLSFSLAKDLPEIEEDPSRVEQVLVNLVINAGEAIPPKTDANIEVVTGTSEITPETAGRQSRYSVTPGKYVWLEVRDNGAGIDDATLFRIFDPFFSTKFTGRGLGLAAVDGIVRSSKGFVEVSSASDAGATFRVYLPASNQSGAVGVEAIVGRRERRSPSILVVDDEELVRRLASMILKRHGYEVLEASDGKHALQLLAESSSLPSAVLLDLTMPVMGGDELIPILENQHPKLKIIVSSGCTEQELRSRLGGASIAGFLQKPFTAVELTNKVEDIVGGVLPQRGQLVQFPKYLDMPHD